MFRALALAVAVLSSPIVHAQDYPTRPVRLIVAFTAGGTADRTARLIAAKLESTLGQAIAVENKPGANGAVAAQYVAQAEPDGYTLFFTTAGAIAISPAFHSDLNYDPIKDFAPVGQIVITPFVLVINKDVPAADLSRAGLAHSAENFCISPFASLAMMWTHECGLRYSNCTSSPSTDTF